MRALDFFLDHYHCTVQELGQRLAENPNLPIPPYQCAHPRLSMFSHIRECTFIDFVHPCSCDHKQLLCICQPVVYEPPIQSLLFNQLRPSTSSINFYLGLIEQAWSEPLYLLLEDLEICPLNRERRCQFQRNWAIGAHQLH